MPDTPRVAIVGGGVAGLSTALELTRLGCESVTLLERDLLAGKSSSLSTGVFTRQYLDPLDIEMRAYGHRYVSALERQGQLAFRRIGYMRLARDEATLEQFRVGLTTLHGLGVLDSRVLDVASISEVVPDMGTHEIAGALWNPTDGYLDGQVLCRVLAEQADEAGVRIVQRSPVLGVESGPGGALRLVLKSGMVDADVVVNAAGAWADAVGQMLGAPVPCFPIREQVCLGRFPRELPYAMPFVMDYVVGDPEPGLWLRDEGHRGFLAGLHSNEPLEPPVSDPDNYVRTVDDEFLEDLAGRLLDRFPSLPDLGLKAGWTGLYPTSPDGQVMVGPHPSATNVVVVAGLGGVGIMLAPALGRLAAEWIMQGQPTVVQDAERLLPGRVIK